MSQVEAYITCRVICYDCHPDDVARRLAGRAPGDVSWYTVGDGEFEIVDAEVDE